MPYSENFSDHIQSPRNVGELADADAVGEETNPICGDRIRLSLKIEDGRIQESRFLAYGCPPTLACGSVLTELLYGKSVGEAMAITKRDLLEALGGLPARKHHAASLAIETLRAALEPACSTRLSE
jgi:nitrogen fixation protein NifU and related proteins